MPSSAARTRSAPVVARVRPNTAPAEPGESGQGPGAPDRCGIISAGRRIRPGRSQRGLEPAQPDAADAERPVQDARAVRASGPQPPPRRARLPGQREPGRGHLAGPRPGQRRHHRLPGAGRHQGAALLGHPGADGGARAVPAPGDERAPARQAQLGGDPRPDPAERRGPGDDVRQQAGVEAERGRCARPTTCPPPGRRSGNRTRAPGRPWGGRSGGATPARASRGTTAPGTSSAAPAPPTTGCGWSGPCDRGRGRSPGSTARWSA